MRDVVTILSIDGGGIRGLIPALVLADIESRTGKRVADLFDLVIGTSTGGLLGLGLSMPGDDGRPRYEARDLIQLYEQQGSTIFSKSRVRRIANLDGMTDELYDSGPIEEVLQRYFGKSRLRDALTEVVVTSYDIERRDPYFFKSFRARSQPERDCFMWQAARATSAAPTYFEPYRLEADGNVLGYRALVDGGVFANNPALAGYAEAQVLTRRPGEPDDRYDYLLVSLGTGQLTRRYRYDDAKDWGKIGWFRPVLDIVFDGVSDAVDYQMRLLLEEFKDPTQYYRFQCELSTASDDMDNATDQNLRDLRIQAEGLIEKRHKGLDAVCRRLVDATAARARRSWKLLGDAAKAPAVASPAHSLPQPAGVTSPARNP